MLYSVYEEIRLVYQVGRNWGDLCRSTLHITQHLSTGPDLAKHWNGVVADSQHHVA